MVTAVQGALSQTKYFYTDYSEHELWVFDAYAVREDHGAGGSAIHSIKDLTTGATWGLALCLLPTLTTTTMASSP